MCSHLLRLFIIIYLFQFTLCYIVTPFYLPTFYGKKAFEKYADKRVNWEKNKRVLVMFVKYPREIATFTDDTYSCRSALGLTFFMLRGTSRFMERAMRTFIKDMVVAHGPTLNAFYDMTATRAYSFMPYYIDGLLGERFYYPYHKRKFYQNYIEIKLHGMSVLDGFLIMGGKTWPYKDANRLGGSSWLSTLTRWSVNYTSDYNEWNRYKNKDGKEHHFRVLEMTRKDGNSYPGYHKLEPRIIARSIRIVFLSYRMSTGRLGGGMVMELFGCSYDDEHVGLQTPTKIKKENYWLTKDIIFPWQLHGIHEPYHFIKPEKQAAMVLSKFYVDDLKNAMPALYGHCQEQGGKNPIRLSLVQKGDYEFPNGSPLRYRRRNHNELPMCIRPEKRSLRNDPFKSVECFGRWSRFQKAWGFAASKKVKYESVKYNKIRYIAESNELETVMSKKLAKARTKSLANHWCAQEFVKTKFTFKPHSIVRTTDCNDIVLAYGDTYCKSSLNKYWNIDLGKICLIDSLNFKGHKNVARKSWATHVKVMYSIDQQTWLPLKLRYSQTSNFVTNTGARHTSHHLLNPRIRARFLRITPVKGRRDSCMRVEIRGCNKEPWLEAQQKIKDDAKRIGFNMWHVVVSPRNEGERLQIKCYQDDARVNGTETVYEIFGSYEFPLKSNVIKLTEQKEAKFYKCVARDQLKRVVSTQIYIITSFYRTLLLVPVQDQGLLHQGGMPLLDPYGTIWAYEPVTAKLTFMYFPKMRNLYEWYGRITPPAWNLGNMKILGKAKTKDECFQLATYANERYFVFSSTKKECFAGWALPYLVDPRENLADKVDDKKMTHVYTIEHRRKPYGVHWKKGEESIGFYENPVVEPTTLFQALLSFGVGKFRFRYDSHFTTRGYDMHSLIIKDFTVDEVKDFTITIMDIDWIPPKPMLNRTVVLRHYGEPRINMPATGGACVNHPLIITAVPLRGEYVVVEEWEVEWRKMENGKALKTNMETRDPFVLKAERAAVRHSGIYRIRAKNRYGFVEGFIQIVVVEDPPSITSVTSSPHVAVEDTSDVLHVDMRNEDELVSIDWYYNEKLIEIEDKHFTFPGSHPGRPDTRKMLKLSNLHSGMSGVFKVVAKAKYCEFTKEIAVDVYVRPKMIVIPNVRTLYQIAGGDATIVRVVVAGGNPTPEKQHLVWYKDSKPLESTRSGRVRVHNQEWLEQLHDSKEQSNDDILHKKRKRIGWNSTLSISSPRVSDSGKYSFMVSFPRTNYTVERTIKVTKL